VNKKLQRLGIFLVIAYLAIFARLHQTQLFEVDALAEREDNAVATNRKINQPRGMILSADGAILAQSVNVGGNNVARDRRYPEGELFGHITGYFSRLFKTDGGVERTYDEELSGGTLRQQVDGLSNLFAGTENVGNVTLTLRKDLQELAREQLGEREGAVTVLDPRTGAILAMWSFPSYDPQPLTIPLGTTSEQAQAAWNAYNNDPRKPLLSKAYREHYLPGSTFKPVTGAAGLRSGRVTASDPDYPQLPSLKFPDAVNPIRNFQGSVCGGDFVQIMKVSCNTGFMQMAVDVGKDVMFETGREFGWEQDVPIDLPGAVQSRLSDGKALGQAGLAQTSIGQLNNVGTPLQMAMVMAAAANNGTIMTPHVMHNVSNSDGTVVATYAPEPWKTPLSPDLAQTLRGALYTTTGPGGTAQAIKPPPGFQVGGKTGTAEFAGGLDHVWFTAFGGPAGQAPTVAISVVVLRQQNTTGGGTAAPIANAILNKAFEVADTPVVDSRQIVTTTTTTVAPPPGPFATTTTTRRRQGG
jgi:peptidoglycan glycosyltransferase